MDYSQAPRGRPRREDDGGGMTQWLKYVPIDELVVHLAKGWAVSDDLHGTNHGFYSCLCVWVGEGEPT
jgi:hypothetical protein